MAFTGHVSGDMFGEHARELGVCSGARPGDTSPVAAGAKALTTSKIVATCGE